MNYEMKYEKCNKHSGCELKHVVSPLNRYRFIGVHRMPDKEFNNIMDQRFVGWKYPWIRRRLTRAFTVGDDIYRRCIIRIGEDRLMKHEYGHIEGYKHNWLKPNLMHPMWCFRWFNNYGIKKIN